MRAFFLTRPLSKFGIPNSVCLFSSMHDGNPHACATWYSIVLPSFIFEVKWHAETSQQIFKQSSNSVDAQHVLFYCDASLFMLKFYMSNNKFGQWKFFPPNSLTRFPPWGFIKEPKIRNSWWMQCLDDQCRSHLGTKPKDLRLPLVCEEKVVLSSLDVFRDGRFYVQFFSRNFSKSFAQTCLGTNARPLVC